MTQGEAPDSRSYIHKRAGCQGTTGVTEGHFERLADPLCGADKTFCVNCNDFVPVSEVYWADTDEQITAYRTKHCAKIPAMTLWLATSANGLLALAVLAIGGGIGFYVGQSSIGLGITAGVVAVIILFVLQIIMGVQLTKFIHDEYFGGDVRLLK